MVEVKMSKMRHFVNKIDCLVNWQSGWFHVGSNFKEQSAQLVPSFEDWKNLFNGHIGFAGDFEFLNVGVLSEHIGESLKV